MELQNQKLLELYKEYQSKIDDIRHEYGKKEGFIIEGEPWWDNFRKKINSLLEKTSQNTLTEEEALQFYKSFGFGPKLYGNTFIENGLDNIKKVLSFLADPKITSEEKITNIVEKPESEFFLKGIGINFVTLFLTVQYPNMYVQWNMRTDSALKLLNLFPTKVRGESKATLYSKINNVCKEIGKLLKIDLPHVDNLLYCLDRGFVGEEYEVIDSQFETEEVAQEVIEEQGTEEIVDKHKLMMYFLIKIGLNKGYDVWVAENDKNKTQNTEKFNEICLTTLPNFTQPSTLNIAKYIDVIWFRKATSYPIRFFEIEHSTSIFSGLLRLNDVKIDYPLSKATIVIPKERINLFDTQIERRTFKYSELSDICDSLTYEDLEQWYNAVNIDSQFS